MRSISSPASARAKNWARGWAEATHSECREAPPARRKGSTLLSDSRAPRLKECAKIPSPARLKRDFTRFAVSKIEMKSQRATANAAERQRSRSEADTGRRIGASFGLEFGARASSAIPEGIAVLGEGDALAARGGRAEDEPERKVRCSCDPKGRRACALGLWPTRGARSPKPKDRFVFKERAVLCDSESRAVRRHPTRRAATRRGSLRLRWRRTASTRRAEDEPRKTGAVNGAL